MPNIDTTKKGGTREDLLRRATGAAPAPPAFDHRRPAKEGAVLSGPPTKGSALTEQEMAAMQAAGLDPTQPVPRNLADVLAAARAELDKEAAELPSRMTDPRKAEPMPIVPIASLPTAEQEKIKKAVQQAYADEQEGDRKAAQARVDAVRNVPSLKLSPSAQQLIDREFGNTQPPAVVPAAAAAAPASPASTPAPGPTPESPSGAIGSPPLPETCPHCLWHLSLPCPTEPSEADQMAHMLDATGRSLFQKTYPAFGGNLHMTFRNLTPRENAQIFLQASADMKAGKGETTLDHVNMLSNYRLCLSLRRIESDDPRGVSYESPEGLSPGTNKYAQSHWITDPPKPDDPTVLPHIEAYLLDQVLTTETMMRVALLKCHEFNRLVAKMEALADHPDFPVATASRT